MELYLVLLMVQSISFMLYIASAMKLRKSDKRLTSKQQEYIDALKRQTEAYGGLISTQKELLDEREKMINLLKSQLNIQ